jgi:hypothetical protein
MIQAKQSIQQMTNTKKQMSKNGTDSIGGLARAVGAEGSSGEVATVADGATGVLFGTNSTSGDEMASIVDGSMSSFAGTIGTEGTHGGSLSDADGATGTAGRLAGAVCVDGTSGETVAGADVPTGAAGASVDRGKVIVL